MNLSKIEATRKKFFNARVVFAVGVLPACALMLAGCGLFPERRANPTAPGAVPRVVFVAGAPDGNWSAAQRGAKAAGKALGATIEWHAPSAKSPDGKTPLKQQDNWVEEAAKTDPAGVILAPINPTGMVPPINKVGKKFVPVLIFDAPVYTKETLTYLKNDDQIAGQIAARAAAKIAAGTGRVRVLSATGSDTDNVSSTDSADSFKATLKKEFPAIQVVHVTTVDDTAGVLYASDEATSRAVLKKISPETQLIATGSSADLITALQNEKISALVVPDRYEMAYQSVHIIYEYYSNRPPEKEMGIAPVLVTKENLQSSKSRRVLGLE